jgi:hypothetical protein
MSNTYDSLLIPARLEDALISVAQSRLAPLNAFSRSFSSDTLKPLAKVQVRKALSGSTTQTNATTFSGGDSAVDNIEVTVAQYTQLFHVSNADLQSGMKLDHILAVNAGAFYDKIMDVALAPATEANFSTPSFTGSYQTFTEDDLLAAYVAIKNAPAKFAVLDSGYFGKMKFQQKTEFRSGAGSFMGFENIFENTRWTGAGTNIRGIACGEDAIAIATGLPVMPTGAGGQYITINSLTLPIGITVYYSAFFDPATRNVNAAFDVMLGAAAGDTSIGTLIKT